MEKLQNEELRNSLSSPNVIRMTKTKTMKWARNVEHVGK